MKKILGRLPTAVVACVGGGSNAIGLFQPFYHDRSVRMIGVEAGGEGVLSKRHAATLSGGSIGVLHGARTYLLQDDDGQVIETHSISAGLDYPGVGPEHAFYKWSGRAKYVAATDQDTLIGFKLLSQTEGIIPALESAHAIGYLAHHAREFKSTDILVVGLSGRGDKDVNEVEHILKKGKFVARQVVIPAKAGIQVVNNSLRKVQGLDSRFRGNDDLQRRKQLRKYHV
jgi:tryptophan synthase beta subunit